MSEQDDRLQLISGQLHALLLLSVAREMFGKGWFALGTPEMDAVYAAAAFLERTNSQWLSPERIAEIVATPQQQASGPPKSAGPGFVGRDKKE